MNDSLNTLLEYVETILRKDSDLKSLEPTVLHYGLFLRKILNSSRPDFISQRDVNEPTQTLDGEALTPWHAAACMEDRTRTAAFIRGSIRAVEHALQNSSKRPLHLIEAGCGPLGTLVLPLLAHFSREELEVSLIDLHQESIDCVNTMLDYFDFLPRVKEMVVGDATAIELTSPADLILTETMNSALCQEPQVAISQFLVRSHPNATLIPQSICIDCVLLNFSQETSQIPLQIGERITLGRVFELCKDSALMLKEEDQRLPAAKITIPDSVAPDFTPWLTTTVQVFDEVRFSDYETQISVPLPLITDAGQPIARGATLGFSYRLGSAPGFIFQVL